MAITKKEAFEENEVKLATYAKALSHPARIAILRILAQRKTCICGEIVEVLPLAQSTVSQHLKELKNVGLINGEIDGIKSCYCINWVAYKEMMTLYNNQIADVSAMYSPSIKCC